MKRTISLLAVFLLVTVSVFAQSQFTVNDMLSLKRVGYPELSPDGKTIAYTIGTVDKEANRVTNQIYTVNIDGSGKKQITTGNASSSSPKWSPDGTRIAFVTGGQIWTMSPSGENRVQVTNISTGAAGPVWSADGKWIAFTSEVYPECPDDACNKAEDERVANSKVKAYVTDRLLFKHWNEWRHRKRTHVFIVSSAGGAARDMTPGDFDSPPYSAATGIDYTFSPDGKTLVYLRNPDKVEAVSTNSDIFLLPIEGGEAKNITKGMNGYDAGPVYTRDGRYLLFRSQKTPTFEADRWRIMRYDTRSGEIVELTTGFDLQADDITLSPDGKTIYFAAGERGRAPIFSVPVEPDFRLRIATHVRKVVDNVTAGHINVTSDSKTFVFGSSSLTYPNEIMRANVDGTGLAMVAPENQQFLAKFGLRKAEETEWIGAENTPNHGFVVKPSNFNPAKKYPILVMIHGGPQGAWMDGWSFRWNPQIYANQGYVVFMPNPRGSTTYGQKFVDEISGDWGGKVYTDIMNGVADFIKRPYADKDRIGAAGASYGGYMVAWLLGHNNDPRFRFKTFVSHAGVYNLESMATSTEEIFFVNWEFKGMPWENPEMYARWSPHKFAKNFDTPTLVTGGELDFRVPIDQCLQLYTTLQLQGVESKLVVFPDEGHWILKPQNSEFWHREVISWLNKHLNP
ncbi:MAG: S9 family peptidase [Acidobacteriota bacterium]|nr:MAG: S9 family peptidase [Acidobacteriota bacterium]